MKSAIYQKEHVRLDQLDRSSYQKLYNAGKNGELFCPVCSEKVRMYLGFRQAPCFFHVQASKNPCPDPVPAAAYSAAVSSRENNGFRLPQGRRISDHDAVELFRPAKSLACPVPFTFRPESSGKKAPYLQELETFGITLDDNQAAAVTDTTGALLVLSGAGSGKTRVLTARTAYMLEVEKLDPNTIMLVTFTSKAAAEMKARLLSYPNMRKDRLSRLVTGTFHSIFYRILMFHDSQNWSPANLLKKEWQRDKILKEAGKELNLSVQEFAFDLALQQIGYWKNALIYPDHVKPENEWEEKTAFLYKKYEAYKREKGLFDFDDMLLGCYQLFISSPAILEQYQERFHYFLIDEFQDINKVQYELIKLLSAKHQNVCAVGDDDQAIYSFRGSDPGYLLDFEKDFPHAKVVTLDQNYRSAHEIVQTANQVIALNKHRRSKQMKAQFSSGHAPVLFFPYDEEEEATMIVTDIQEKIENGASPSDFAILYRTNAASRAVFERLATSNLPFKIDQDAESFYDRYIVRCALSFLKISLQEDDVQAMSDILPLLFLKQTVLQDIKAFSILKDCSLLEALTHVKTAHAFQEKKIRQAVQAIRSLKTASPVTAIEKMEKELGFLDFLKKRGNESNKLEKGSDDLKDLKTAAKGFRTISELLAHASHMSAMNKEIKNLGKHFTEGVTLSTIHRSKGLEYKIVYCIGAVDGSLPHDYALESRRSGDFTGIEEERRLFYVAITRAKDELYISIPENRRGKKANRSRFLAPLFKKS